MRKEKEKQKRRKKREKEKYDRITTNKYAELKKRQCVNGAIKIKETLRQRNEIKYFVIAN